MDIKQTIKAFNFKLMTLLSFVLFAVSTISVSQAEDRDEPILTRTSPFASEIYKHLMYDEFFSVEPCRTLFVGSSSIRFWFTLADDFPYLEVTNKGFGGATYADVNRYFPLLVTSQKPERIIVYAGDNDVGAGRTAQDIADDFKIFLAAKDESLSSTPVYVISIKPSVARASEFDIQSAANTALKTIAEARPDVTFVDIATPMKASENFEGLFLRDNLHMNAAGYAIWTEIIQNVIDPATETSATHCVSAE